MLRSGQSMPVRRSRGVLVLEMIRDIEEPPTWVSVLLSIPGRPTMFSRTWKLSRGRMESSQYEDVMTWIQLTVADVLLLAGTVQDRLPME